MFMTLLIILDGLSDRGKRTPLELAHTPNLDFMAKQGRCGLMYPIKGIAPESGASQFVLLGYNLKKYPGRGPVEALGAGYRIKKGEVAIRCNFSDIKKFKRVKIPSKSIIKKLNRIDKDIKIIPTIGYRAIMIVKNVSPNIRNTHPGYVRYKSYSKAVKVRKTNRRTGNKKIDSFLKKAEKILKNKTILLRGAGNKIPKLRKLKNWSLIADMPVEIGIGKMADMKILERSKNEIKQIIGQKGNVYVQIKGPDKFGHVGDIKGKIKAIEKIDRTLKPLKNSKTLVCVTSDHSTPCKLKRHSADPVPILVYSKNLKKDGVSKFSESSCKKGSLGIIQGKNLMKVLNRVKKS